MKKFIIFSLFAVMIAGMAFAADGITINAWGRGAFSPLIIEGKAKEYGEAVDGSESNTFAGTGVTWGGPLPRVDFRIVGATEHVGFAVASTGESGAGLGGADDAAHLWAKPFGSDILKLTVGKFVDDTLRGKVGSVNGGFECFTLWGYGNNEEDPIFNRFSSYGSTWGSAPGGFMLSSAPVDGLFLGLMVNGSIWNWGGPGTKLADAYKYMQIGAGYEIEGIGHIRAQWVGGNVKLKADKDVQKILDKNGLPQKPGVPAEIGYLEDGTPVYATDPDTWTDVDWTRGDFAPSEDDYKPARIEFAFALTAVENLTVDLGAKIWLPVTADISYTLPTTHPWYNPALPLEYKDMKASNGIDVSVGASFDSDAFGITGRVDAKSLGAYVHTDKDDKSSLPMTIDVRLVPYYKIDDVSIGLDLGMIAVGKGKAYNGDAYKYAGPTVIGFGGWVSKALAGGYVKAGLTYTTAPIEKAEIAGSEKSGANGRGVFAIPIVLEYAFF